MVDLWSSLWSDPVSCPRPWWTPPIPPQSTSASLPYLSLEKLVHYPTPTPGPDSHSQEPWKHWTTDTSSELLNPTFHPWHICPLGTDVPHIHTLAHTYTLTRFLSSISRSTPDWEQTQTGSSSTAVPVKPQISDHSQPAGGLNPDKFESVRSPISSFQFVRSAPGAVGTDFI